MRGGLRALALILAGLAAACGGAPATGSSPALADHRAETARAGAPLEGSRPCWGALMTEVGRRYELLGLAARAGRWDLAEYELGEIEEVFRDDLPIAEPPPESMRTDLKGLAQAFVQTHPADLRAALRARDGAAFAKAFAAAAATCNGCHRESGHSFIEVPTEPGARVPRVDPAP